MSSTKCEHCIDGWVPLTRQDQEDAELVTREMAVDAGSPEMEGDVYRLLVLPTADVPCYVCNSMSFTNSDLSEVRV